MNVKISNLNEKQVTEIEDMLKKWVDISDKGDSRWTSFFIDKDFHPKIKIKKNVCCFLQKIYVHLHRI